MDPPSYAGSESARTVRTVLVVDMVESVRLMEENEDETISRWRAFVKQVEAKVLPAHRGRFVKSLGDGMLLEFPRVPLAVHAAFAIQRACHGATSDMPPHRRILLRMGIQVGELVADEHDVYGREVNLAARLTTLAGPGEIVVSAGVRDQLTPVLDAEIEDLGECYLKHVRQPVRAFRIGPPGPRPVVEPGTAVLDLRPTIAVIPFVSRSSEPAHEVLGEVMADEVIAALSRSSGLNVISRLSTTVFRGRQAMLTEMGAQLNARYVLSGAYQTSGNQLVLMAELADASSGVVVWADQLAGTVRGILSRRNELVDRLVVQTSTAVIAQELHRAQTQALPNLESYTLLIASISLMHRLSPQDFDRARQMLQTLIERVPRQAVPRAWLAKWHVLRVQQGWSEDTKADGLLALDCTKRALDSDPRCSLALAVDGLVHTNVLKQLDVALERYEAALGVNPNDSLAWLLKGTLHAFRGEGELAVNDTKHALKLSPFDPHRYFYDSLAATAELAAGRYEQAIELARRSLSANRTHVSTLRALAIAQWQSGRFDDARRTVTELRRLDPTLTVKTYLERSPSSAYETGRIWSDALREAGIPE